MLDFLPTSAFPRPEEKNGGKLVCADTDTAEAAGKLEKQTHADREQ